jgi:hypothetical protein
MSAKRFTLIIQIAFNLIIVADTVTGVNHKYSYPDGIKPEDVNHIHNLINQLCY